LEQTGRIELGPVFDKLPIGDTVEFKSVKPDSAASGRDALKDIFVGAGEDLAAD
jgi:hypothetical protein